MKTSMPTRIAGIHTFSLLAGICLICFALVTPHIVQAASTISARYVKAQGTQLVIEVLVGPNPPASAILVQRFPPGIRMINSQPAASNYNPQDNTAKWLLRNLRPGSSTVSVSLDRAVNRNQISADLRFKPQDGGAMTTIQVGK